MMLVNKILVVALLQTVVSNKAKIDDSECSGDGICELHFDDIDITQTTPVPNGYMGFNFKNLNVVYTPPFEETNPESGYVVGCMSPPNVATAGKVVRSQFKTEVSRRVRFISQPKGPAKGNMFSVVSMHVTPAWNNNLNVKFEGWYLGEKKSDLFKTLLEGPYESEYIEFDDGFDHITKLTITSWGGSSDGDESSKLVIDNMILKEEYDDD